MAVQTAGAARRERQAERRTECGTPRCAEPPAAGSRFCAEHGANLARIKAEMAVDSAIRGRSAVRAREAMPKKRPSTPTCCNLGCFNERVPPAAFCDACVDAGATQEDDE